MANDRGKGPYRQHRAESSGGKFAGRGGGANKAGANARRGSSGGRQGHLSAANTEPERIQKLLARHGVGSRRQVEAWIAEGRIQVNGKTAEAGASVSPADRITLDGKAIVLSREAAPRVLAYRKRVGEVVARTDPERRPTVFRRLPRVQGGRWVAVGRLDINTSGLLLFTTDGELASRLMHPSYEVEREYAVRVLGGLSDEAIKELRAGVMLDDGMAKVVSLVDDQQMETNSANRWYRMVISEGRNREVRRLIEAVGGQVSRLMRVRYGPITIPRGVPSGRGRELDENELQAIYATVGLKVPQAAMKRASLSRTRNKR